MASRSGSIRLSSEYRDKTTKTLEAKLRDTRILQIFDTTGAALAGRGSSRSILGGVSTDARSLQNIPFLTNPRARQLWTNQLYIQSSNYSVSFDNGIALPVNKGTFAVSIGANAGTSNQGANAVAIGGAAGDISQSPEAVAIGFQAGFQNQPVDSVFVGAYAGAFDSGTNSVNVGYRAGRLDQSRDCTAIGAYAGDISQGKEAQDFYGTYYGAATAIGANAGRSNQEARTTNIGYGSGEETSRLLSTTIGASSGSIKAGFASTSIGYRSLYSGLDGTASVDVGDNINAIGCRAGEILANRLSLSIGSEAGQLYMGTQSISIGCRAGNANQGSNSISIGCQAGEVSQGPNCIAIGFQAGRYNQSSNSIAIGSKAGYFEQHENTIIINATGQPLNSNKPDSIYIAPIRTINTSGAFGKLSWDPSTKEVLLDTTKTFIIDHPENPENRYLVHACIEGPESGVFYRGKGEIINDKSTDITLPSYVCKFAKDFTVNLQPFCKADDKIDDILNTTLAHSNIENNTFTVYGKSCYFSYVVFGKRGEIDVEPDKSKYELKGDGPYTYLEEK